jgi:hypothetical protein
VWPILANPSTAGEGVEKGEEVWVIAERVESGVGGELGFGDARVEGHGFP